MTAPVIDFIDLAGWGFILVQKTTNGGVETIGKNFGFCIVCFLSQVFERNRDGEEFPEGVPA